MALNTYCIHSRRARACVKNFGKLISIRKENMKTKLITSLLLNVLAGTLYADRPPIFFQTCSEDRINGAEAVERIEWATKCSYLERRDKEYLLNSDGRPRQRPLYPLFGKLDFSEIYRAPIDRRAECRLPEEFRLMAFCTASSSIQR